MNKGLKNKKDDEAKQQWVGIPPNAAQCKKCIHAYPDTKFTVGAEKANCEMYQPPEDKPPGVLQNTVNCDFYEEA